MKTAVITGAGSGVGRSSAIALCEEGFDLALVGRRVEVLEETAGLCRAANPQARTLCLSADVSDAASVDRLFETVLREWGRVDLLFNNAGVSPAPALVDELSIEQWRDAMAVNLDGAFFCARAAFRAMRGQDPQGGRIINNGSVSSRSPRPRSVAYTVAKHGIRGLTRSLALDGRAYNIACSQIDIGNAATGMTRAMASGVLQADLRTAAEPTIETIHVAAAVRYIASLPLHANVLDMTIMATAMPFVGRG